MSFNFEGPDTSGWCMAAMQDDVIVIYSTDSFLRQKKGEESERRNWNSEGDFGFGRDGRVNRSSGSMLFFR